MRAKIKTVCFLLTFLIFSHTSWAELTFGNYEWWGDYLQFDNADEGKLCLNADHTLSSATIFTTDVPCDSISRWKFVTEYNFMPSTSNYSRFFFLSDVEQKNGVALRAAKYVILEHIKNGKVVAADTAKAMLDEKVNAVGIIAQRVVAPSGAYVFTVELAFMDRGNEMVSIEVQPEAVQLCDRMALQCKYTKTRANAMAFDRLELTTGFVPPALPDPEPPIEVTDAFHRGCIVINEYMPIPSDALGLPDVEYIELKNMTSANYNLRDWVITNGKTNGRLPDYILKADSVVLLCIKTHVADFEAMGYEAIAPSSWPAITNSACRLTLCNHEGKTADVVEYSQSIFANHEAGDRGFSIERIDGLNLSGRVQNWAVCPSPLGGTPSLANASAHSNPDTDKPRLTQLDLMSDGQTLRMVYDEPLDTSNMLLTLTIDDEVMKPRVLSVDATMLRRIALELSQPLEKGHIYKVQVPALRDLASNESDASDHRLALPDEAEVGDVIVSEVMFAAKPASGDYIEIYNRSQKVLDLNAMYFAAYKDTVMGEVQKMSPTKRLIFPGDYMVLCSDSAAVVDAYGLTDPSAIVRVPKCPSLADDKGSLALVSAQGEVWERIDYSRTMLGLSASEAENVSLERIDLEVPASDPKNWAAATQSNGYATPARANSTDRPEPVDPEPPIEVTDAFHRGCIVINEYMPISSDALGLPDVEYIELKNMTSANYNLRDWVITNGKTNGRLPDYILKADSVVLLCVKTHVADFEAMGYKAIAPSAWPAITNSACRLTLCNHEGKTADHVVYDQSIFGGTFKKDGGYAVERIDGYNLSGQTTNWAISTAEVGGTPYAKNSVAAPNEDLECPRLTSVDLSDDGLYITISVDEPLDTTVVDPTFAIDGVSMSARMVMVNPTTLATLCFALDEPIMSGRVHKVRLPELVDMVGNAMEAQEYKLAIPDEAEVGDVVINEIMYAAKPSSGDFVEIYNRSQKTFDLSTLHFGVFKDGVMTEILPMSPTKRLFFPGEYMVLCADSAAVVNAYGIEPPQLVVKVPKFPSLADNKGTVAIVSVRGEEWERVDYELKLYGPGYSTIENVSIERIRTDIEANNQSNWAGAAQGAGYATPCKPNSQCRDNMEATESDLELQNRVFTPDGDGIDDELIIRTRTSDGVWLATVRIYSADGRLIAMPANNQTLSVAGELRWNGRTDEGETVSPGTYIVHVRLWQREGGHKNFKKTCTVAQKPQ